MKEEDQFFNEELRTHSAEEYQALKREVEALNREIGKLRRTCVNLAGMVKDAITEGLYTHDVTQNLMTKLDETIERHPELREGIVAIGGGERLRDENRKFTKLPTEEPPPDKDEGYETIE